MVAVPCVNHVVHGSVIKPEVIMIKKGKGYDHFAARVRNIMDFHMYSTYKLQANHYFIRTLKPLNIISIDIPKVGSVTVNKPEV